MKYKLIIFDMDGVLVDSEPAIKYSSQLSLLEWGVHASPDDFHEFTGMGDDKFIGGVAQKYGVEYKTEMKKRAYEIYLANAAEKVMVYPWSKNILNELYSAGYTLALASASDYVKVECNINCIGVDKNIFSAVITGSDVKNKKPAPDIFLKAFESAKEKNITSPQNIDNISKNEVIVIEDSLSGVMAAKAAGMIAIAVTTSFCREELQKAGADYITDSLENLPFIISSRISDN